MLKLLLLFFVLTRVKSETTESSIEPEFTNRTIRTGNELWDNLFKECTKSYKISCVQKNVYSYLATNLEQEGDYTVTDSIVFKPNVVDFKKYSRELNEVDSDEEEDEIEEARSIPKPPIEEVADGLYGKGIKFMMTHDLELKMPDTFFEGATFKISPRAIEGNGALVHLEMVPKQIVEEEEQRGPNLPKIFKKKIQKFFRGKLLTSFLAIMLVIKLIKVKLMFVLPVLVGVGTAKKIILKVLLFLFPALSHLFKLCSYYHENYHATKYHHHHHQIAHVHHPVPDHVHDHGHDHDDQYPYASSHHYAPPPDFVSGPGANYPGSIVNHEPHFPASLLPSPGYVKNGKEQRIPPFYTSLRGQFKPDDPFELAGPGFGPEFVRSPIHRTSSSNDFEPGPNDAKEIYSWGLGGTTELTPGKEPFGSPSKKVLTYVRPGANKPAVAPIDIPKQKVKDTHFDKDNSLKAKLQQEKFRLHQEHQRLQEQLKSQENNKLQQQIKLHEAFKQQAKLKDQTKILPTRQLIDLAVPQSPLNAPVGVGVPNRNQSPVSAYQPAPVSTAVANPISYNTIKSSVKDPQVQSSDAKNVQFTIQKSISTEFDPFYSPILEKVDAIFSKLGVYSEGCRERLICSMYKNPARFSPHSNLLSAELSRDSRELEKPTTTNGPVIRFYKYVQAARDGQENNDCLKMYNLCTFATE